MRRNRNWSKYNKSLANPGSLAVIANAPNPAGHAILGKHFKDGISHVGLFVAALIPMLVVTVGFWFARVLNLI